MVGVSVKRALYGLEKDMPTILVFVGFWEERVSNSPFGPMRGHNVVAIATALGSRDVFEVRIGIRNRGTGIMASV